MAAKKKRKKIKTEIFELAVESRALERYDTNISKKVIEIEKKNKQVWNLKEASVYFLRDTFWKHVTPGMLEKMTGPCPLQLCVPVLFGCSAKS